MLMVFEMVIVRIKFAKIVIFLMAHGLTRMRRIYADF